MKTNDANIPINVGARHAVHLQNDLPEGWDWKRIKDICNLINGRAFKPSEWSSNGLPIIRIQNLNNNGAEFNYCDFSVDDKYIVNRGQLLFAWSGTPGTSFGAHIWKREKAVLNQHIFKVEIDESSVNKVYLMYLLNRNVDEYIRKAHGTAGLAHITKGKFENSFIPIAPLDQQKLIVAEIEKQFSRLDEAVAAIERIQTNLKRYKASVLKAAIEGKLTEEWRSRRGTACRAPTKDETGADLLKRILVERRKKWEEDYVKKYVGAHGHAPKDDSWKKKYKEPAAPDTSNLPQLPKGWVWVSLSQVTLLQNGRAFPSKDYSLQGIKLLRPGNLYADGLVKWTDNNTRRLPETWAAKYPEYIINGGELIMNLTAQSLRDEFLGRACITAKGERCLLNQRLARILPITGLSPHFLLWLLKARIFRHFVDTLNTGSLIQHMFTSDLAQFNLPLPPQFEQEIIIQEIERRLSVAEESETTVEANLKRADRLRQSILKKAFSGGLINNIHEVDRRIEKAIK